MNRILDERQRDELAKVGFMAYCEAIQRLDPAVVEIWPPDWDGLTEFQKEAYRQEADAVIGAYLRSGQ